MRGENSIVKKYVYRLLGIVIFALLFTMGWNYVYDTSGFFNQDFSIKREEPNQHFVKMRYIFSQPEKYNAFCFGSSRVGNIDLLRIDNGMRYYNMTYSEGIPAEWLNDLQVFIKKGVHIKQVMIGLDDFSFRVDPELHKKQLSRIPYKDNNFLTYFNYLLKQPRKLDNNLDKASVYDIYGSGRPLHPEKDEIIEADIEKHVNDEKFKKPCVYVGNRVKETISELIQLKELCDDNNIQLIVFINPIHAVTHRDTDMQDFNEFKRQLAQVMDYYDFSGLNEITTNNYYYYETSHYRPLVGDMIVNRLFNKGNADFGVYVTKENVDKHLQRLEDQLK